MEQVRKEKCHPGFDMDSTNKFKACKLGLAAQSMKL